jgi:hypothetical protein
VENEEKQFNSAVNMNENCVWLGFSQAVAQISNSNLVAFFVHTQDVWFIK